MTRGQRFEARDEVVRATFEPVEVELLRDLRDQLRATLTSGDEDHAILQRLFPSAVLGDQDADAELRSMLRIELLASRLEGLDELVAILDRGTPHLGGIRVELAEDEPLLLLGVLNDLRLAIGAQIDIESLDRDRAREDDSLGYALAVMDHLAWMQEQLLEIVDPVSVSHYEETSLHDDDPASEDGDTW